MKTIFSQENRNSLFNYFAPMAIFLGATASTILLQLSQVNSSEKHIRENHIGQEGPGFTAEIGKAVGYRGLTASSLWLSFIQYYGDEARREVGYSHASDYLESIVDSEPRFVDAYFLASSAIGYRSSAPESAASLLETALNTVNPDWYGKAYRIPHQLAGLNFLFLGNEQKSRDYYYQAAEWYETTHEDSRQGWRDLANKIANNPRSKRAQFNAWMQSYQVNPDPEIQDYILQKLDELGEVKRLPDGTIQILPPTDG